MKPFHYALFDVDGTLIDSMRYWESAAKEFLEKNGKNTCVTAEMHEKLHSMSPVEGVIYLAEICGREVKPEEFVVMLDRHYRHDVSLRPGVRESLLLMKENGVHMAVLSASFEEPLRRLFGRLGIDGMFEFIMTAESYPQGNSDKTMFLDACRRLEASPEEIVLFEDAYYSIATAKSLGMRIVGIEDSSEKEKNAVMEASELYFQDGIWKPSILPFSQSVK